MATVHAVSTDNLAVVTHNQVPVITTDLLAQLYGTDIDNIKQNFTRNQDRFIEGKHYFKLEGLELKAFKNMVTNSHYVPKNAARLMLWTERGAARHAKMLDTDQAWDVFEKLEDSYFVEPKPEIPFNPHKDIQDELYRVAGGRRSVVAELSRMLRDRFGVARYSDIPAAQCPAAVEYVRSLAGEYIPRHSGITEEEHLAWLRDLVNYPAIAGRPPKTVIPNQHWYTANDFVSGQFDPVRDFLKRLEAMGCNITGLAIVNMAKSWVIKNQYDNLRHATYHLNEIQRMMEFHAKSGMNVVGFTHGDVHVYGKL